MPTAASAARHVVERCPSCGVEHDVSADSLCEACDTPLRYWCRAHGRETGWLAAASCARCAQEAEPGRSAPRRAPESTPRRAVVAPADAAPTIASPTPALPPGSGLGVLLRPPDRMAARSIPAAGSTSGNTVLRNMVLVLAGGAAGGLVLGWLSMATANERVWAAVVAAGLVKAFRYVRGRGPRRRGR